MSHQTIDEIKTHKTQNTKHKTQNIKHKMFYHKKEIVRNCTLEHE